MEKAEFAVAIGQRLHKLREASGQSAEAFAAVGGVSRTAQFAYERGSTIPDAHYLQAIAESQSVGLQWLITGDQVFGAAGITADELLVVERYRGLPNRMRDVIDSVLLLATLAAASRQEYHRAEEPQAASAAPGAYAPALPAPPLQLHDAPRRGKSKPAN